jgi:hypothetical protein
MRAKKRLRLGIVAVSFLVAGPCWGSEGDLVAPELVSFDFNPRAVDVIDASASLTCEIGATDPLEGMGIILASCRFRSPEGKFMPVCYAWQPSSGTEYDGIWACSTTIPQFSEAGTWLVSEVIVIDRAGTSRSYGAAELGPLGFPTELQVTSAYDLEGPVLGSLDFGPRSIDVTTDPEEVTFTMALSDDIAGVSSLNMSLRSPSGTEWLSGYSDGPLSGTIHEGTWSCAVAVPPNAEPGTWVVASVQLADRANNYRSYDTGSLIQRGFPTELQVASARDVERPVLTAFDVSPRSVDVTAAPAQVACEVSATDAHTGSGVQSVLCGFRSPDDAPGPQCASTEPSSGDAYDGTWTCAVTIPQFVESGAWRLSEVVIVDGANNLGDYGSAELEGMGYPTTIQVTSNHDVRPPDLVSFDFQPRSVDVLDHPASVTVEMKLVDALAGVLFVNYGFLSPSHFAGSGCTGDLPSSGTVHDGTWTCLVTLPQGSEVGSWVVSGLQVVDNVYNGAFYSAHDLEQLGFPTRFEVTANPAFRDSDGDGVVDSADACPDSILAATVSIGGIDSGIPNELSPGGCTLADDLSRCALAAGNPGRLVGCVRQSCARLLEAGSATRMQCRTLAGAAARSQTGRPRSGK